MADYADLLSRVEALAGSGREIHDPATGALIARAPELSADDLDAAIARARAA